MLERASALLAASTKAFSIGATSLLELLEAQRSYISTQSDYLSAVATYRQALADLQTAAGALGIYGDAQITRATGGTP